MTAKEELKNEIRTVLGPFLREHGFRGSGTNWRKWSSRGDCALVNVQSSAWNFPNDQSCIINLSVSVHCDFDWLDFWRGSPQGSRRAPTEAWGIWRERLHRHGAAPEKWWNVTDEESAREAVADMIDQLSELGIPTLENLLDRRQLLRAVAGDHLEGFRTGLFVWWAVPLLLCDEGESDELTDVLGQLEQKQVPPEMISTFAQWAKERARRISAERAADCGRSD